jgi:hypothetical protein
VSPSVTSYIAMTRAFFQILTFFGMLAFALAQTETGSAITVNEDTLDTKAGIATATTALAGSTPTTVEATAGETAEATNTQAGEEAESTNIDEEKEEGEGETEAEETYTSENSTTTIVTKTQELDETTTTSIEAPATEVPDLLAQAGYFRDPGAVILSCFSALMLFLMLQA